MPPRHDLTSARLSRQHRNTPLIRFGGLEEPAAKSTARPSSSTRRVGQDRARWRSSRREARADPAGRTIVEGRPAIPHRPGAGRQCPRLSHVIVMPETQSQEKKDFIKLVGAELRLVRRCLRQSRNMCMCRTGCAGARQVRTNGAVWPISSTIRQPRGHRTHRQEIWRDTDGRMTHSPAHRTGAPWRRWHGAEGA